MAKIFGTTGRHLMANESDELQKLPDSFRVFQNIKLGYEVSINFVVAGPTGIFTIEVKSQDGPLEYNGQELTRWKISFEKNPLRQAMVEAVALHNYLKEKLSKDIFIHPVLVFSNLTTHMSFGLRPLENVYVVQKKWLLKLLTRRSNILGSNEIKEIENILLTVVK